MRKHEKPASTTTADCAIGKGFWLKMMIVARSTEAAIGHLGRTL